MDVLAQSARKSDQAVADASGSPDMGVVRRMTGGVRALRILERPRTLGSES
jgi:hypothetical protein